MHLLEDGTWQRIWEILHCRIGSMSLAEKFVRRPGIRAPRPCTWDKDEWFVNHLQSKLGDRASAFHRTHWIGQNTLEIIQTLDRIENGTHHQVKAFVLLKKLNIGSHNYSSSLNIDVQRGKMACRRMMHPRC